MKTRYLFPHKFFKIGMILSVIGLVLLIYTSFVKEFAFLEIMNFHPIFFMKKENFSFELSSIIFILGLTFFAFSRLKNEDEYSIKLRMESLVFAILFNVIISIIGIITIYGFDFIHFLSFNLFSTLIIFIIKFQFEIYKSKKLLQYEK